MSVFVRCIDAGDISFQEAESSFKTASAASFRTGNAFGGVKSSGWECHYFRKLWQTSDMSD